VCVEPGYEDLQWADRLGWCPPSIRSGRTISGIGYVVPHPFAAGENRVVSRSFGS
jgi:hypothetical protein